MEPGYCTEGKVTRVIDGDTLEVTITRKFNVRVRDLWCAENSTEEGKLITKSAHALFAAHDDVLVFIPTNDAEKLMDFNSFNRIVGDIYIKDLDMDYKEWLENGK